MKEKSIVIFTNFWDANTVIDRNSLIVQNSNNEKIYRINFFKDNNVPNNFSVHSIALSHPNLSKQKNMKNMNRLDFFCPTYDMLDRYKKDKNWNSYHKDFIALIKKRKSVIREWAESLIPERVYFLCCWENTIKGAHCHREILHKAFTDSKIISKKIFSIYRHGDECKKDRANDDLIFARDFATVNGEIRALPNRNGDVIDFRGINWDSAHINIVSPDIEIRTINSNGEEEDFANPEPNDDLPF